jgi:hypothetical protein
MRRPGPRTAARRGPHRTPYDAHGLRRGNTPMLEKFLDEFTEPGAAVADEFAARYLAWCQRANTLANRCQTVGKLRQLGLMDNMTVKVRIKNADSH